MRSSDRTPGGAMVAPSGSMEKSFLEAFGEKCHAKDAIGREAAKLVRDGETVVLDSAQPPIIARIWRPNTMLQCYDLVGGARGAGGQCASVQCG